MGRTDSPGTRRLIQAAAEAGADKVRGKPLPAAVVEKMRRAALADGRRPGPTGREWQPWELRLLGTAPDEAVARRTHRTVSAVRVMRTRRGIPSGHGWTAEELALLGTAPDAEIAARIGRTEGAVCQRRCQRGLPSARDRRLRRPAERELNRPRKGKGKGM